MAAKTFLRTFYFVSTIPYWLIAKTCQALNTSSIRNDIDRCISASTNNTKEIPDNLITCLIVAEDHRNELHFGIDHVAIARAIYAILFRGKMEGASTIEQQYVRTVTGRYERTLRRKFREQIIAASISRQMSKNTIASSYLQIAHFGHNCTGVKGVEKVSRKELKNMDQDELIRLICQLKYPRPINTDREWDRKIEQRIVYVRQRTVNP